MELYVVVVEDHLYEGKVGEPIWQDRTRIYLKLDDDTVLLERHEVTRIV